MQRGSNMLFDKCMRFLEYCRLFASYLVSPSISLSNAVDALEWEMHLARSQSSMGSAFSLTFALFYNLFYLPSEIFSLQSLSRIQFNQTSAYSNATSVCCVEHDVRSPDMLNNAIQFYYGRIISRIFLILLMAFCVGAFICSRVCISDEWFHRYFQDYMFKELRGLHGRSASFETRLMRRLVNADMLPAVLNISRKTPSDEEVSICGVKSRKCVLLRYVVGMSAPLSLAFAFIPSYIARLLFPKNRPHTQPFAVLRHACFQMILYNDSIRRSAKVPMLIKDFFGVFGSRIIPRRLFLSCCTEEAIALLDDVDVIMSKFPIEQRCCLYNCVLCHSHCCTFIAALVCQLMFVQNAIASDLVVARWFSTPHSQKRFSPNDPKYPLFYNYRELTNWEYVVNSHFIFLLFFSVLLTCTNTTMFMVLAPSFIVTAAGFYSNQGISIDLTLIDSWFIASLVISYFVCYTTNALTYRDFFKMFVNRTSDFAYVNDNTMLELSHEFMSLSHISLDALSVLCSSESETDARRLRCMMWMLRKQQFEVQKFRPDLVLSDRRGGFAAVSIRKVLRQEFEPGYFSAPLGLVNYAACFASLCDECRCSVEFKFDFSDDANPVLLHAFHSSSPAAGSFKVLVSIRVSDTAALSALSPRLNEPQRDNAAISMPAVTYSSEALADSDPPYLQFFAELLESPPTLDAAAPGPSPWIAAFLEHDNFAVLEFVTRMHGSVQIPLKGSLGPNRYLGAFALPCEPAAADTPSPPPFTLPEPPLRLLIIEDHPKFAAILIAKIKAFPPASNYTIDHESNVEDAHSKFISSAEPYDVVLIDMFMPMKPGGAVDSQAGVIAVRLLRNVEHDRDFKKSVMIGITSGGESDQDHFMDQCRPSAEQPSHIWQCFARDQLWDGRWDAAVRAELSHYRS